MKEIFILMESTENSSYPLFAFSSKFDADGEANKRNAQRKESEKVFGEWQYFFEVRPIPFLSYE
jgi:hypothetical protein